MPLGMGKEEEAEHLGSLGLCAGYLRMRKLLAQGGVAFQCARQFGVLLLCHSLCGCAVRLKLLLQDHMHTSLYTGLPKSDVFVKVKTAVDLHLDIQDT